MELSCCENLTVIIPSLDPDQKLLGVIAGLRELKFANILIVDDGSDAAHQPIFARAESEYGCTVLHHGVNRGKGRGLKTAFNYVLEQLPNCAGVITVDGDGQHLGKDILACGEAMLREGDSVVLGCRDFSLEGIPPRSVFGNRLTSALFRILCGIRLSDTQTGLRAIPRAFLPQFAAMEGERFEYETNMLLQMKRSGIRFTEQSIATVYDPEDYSSHYNAVKDSWRIFKTIFRFLLKR